MIVFPESAPAGQKAATSHLHRLLVGRGAARVGETAVVSLKVHIQDISSPDDVTALATGDAGQVFYHREKEGEVLHIDVFHSPGCLDPGAVALRMISALSGLKFQAAPGAAPTSIEPLLSYIDIQTGAGGGRIDGNLAYGSEEGVRRAHMTHVHIAGLAAPEIIASVFTIVASVESAIEDMGLELRKVKRVRLAEGDSPLDVSGYQASTDSLLRQMHVKGEAGASGTYRREALARKAAQDIGSAGDSAKVLEELARGLKSGEFAKLRVSTDKSPEELRQILTQSGLAKFDGHRYTLTQDGHLALSYLKEHSSEIEAYLRRLLWCLPSKRMPSGDRKGRRIEPSVSRGRGLALPPIEGESLPELAVPETVVSWGIRRAAGAVLGTVGAGEACPTDSRARESECPAQDELECRGIARPDLRFLYSREKRERPVILLLDASASMAGRRIRAAKELARHLVLAGKEKVSVVAFQDSGVKVVSDFTKNRRKIEEGLKEVQAMGLTPLAQGLEKALELSLKSSKKPVVLVITDGIPTVPSRGLSPVEDALEAAKRLAKKGVRLGCIGLEPNRGFLKQMVKYAKGTLYIVDELEASTLAAIARKETSM